MRNIDSAISSNTMPPPTRNEARLVPMKTSRLSPLKAETTRMSATDNVAMFATRLRPAGV